MHFPLGFERDYFEQMRSEKREWRRDKRGNKALWWVEGVGRNEAWDCEVYAYAAFLYATAGRHIEQFWRVREKLLVASRIADLFEQAEGLQEAEQEQDGAAVNVSHLIEVADEPQEIEEVEQDAAAVAPVQALAQRPRARAIVKQRRGFVQRW